eukprot:TRINITY_DN38398_c0_g2_i1.p1 TRINITY_DN38398_c0_g2~~TRINITY_DN38398_c0_g2_i1.p1  ORF type:complete len:360 (-),score=77.89 TRINITY_DN38398_c0_g2_i1:223-1302(-)
MPQKWYCLEIWRVTPEVLALPHEARVKYVREHLTASSEGPFEPGTFDKKAPITLAESVVALAFFGTIVGGPLAVLVSLLGLLVAGSWSSFAAGVLAAGVLAFHPLPDPLYLASSRVTLPLYKYFSYRIMWCDDAYDKADTMPGWIGAGGPHGVLPLANILSMAVFNTFGNRRFLGGGASITLQTPFLRYMTLLGGAVDVSSSTLSRETARGNCIGIVPDGIAGIFTQNTDGVSEEVALKKRKGLAKLSLKKGIPIIPAYSMGNTAVYTSWYDSFGIMESLSRKLKASIFVFWGRFGLPLPHRVNISMLIGDPVVPEAVIPEPSDEDIDKTHQKILQGIEDTFNGHKAACGWGHRVLKFV